MTQRQAYTQAELKEIDAKQAAHKEHAKANAETIEKLKQAELHAQAEAKEGEARQRRRVVEWPTCATEGCEVKSCLSLRVPYCFDCTIERIVFHTGEHDRKQISRIVKGVIELQPNEVLK